MEAGGHAVGLEAPHGCLSCAQGEYKVEPLPGYYGMADVEEPSLSEDIRHEGKEHLSPLLTLGRHTDARSSPYPMYIDQCLILTLTPSKETMHSYKSVMGACLTSTGQRCDGPAGT